MNGTAANSSKIVLGNLNIMIIVGKGGERIAIIRDVIKMVGFASTVFNTYPRADGIRNEMEEHIDQMLIRSDGRANLIDDLTRVMRTRSGCIIVVTVSRVEVDNKDNTRQMRQRRGVPLLRALLRRIVRMTLDWTATHTSAHSMEANREAAAAHHAIINIKTAVIVNRMKLDEATVSMNMGMMAMRDVFMVMGRQTRDEMIHMGTSCGTSTRIPRGSSARQKTLIGHADAPTMVTITCIIAIVLVHRMNPMVTTLTIMNATERATVARMTRPITIRR